MAINTGKVKDRRTLQFTTIEEILDDAEGLAKGKVQTLGNWSPGQIFKHVSIIMNQSIDGSPLKLSWMLRLLGKLMKRRFLGGPMPPGFQLPASSAAVLVPPPTSFEEGLQCLRSAVHRLQTETTRAPSPFLGKMSLDEWNVLHCRHASLHLSFIVPVEATAGSPA